MTKAVIEEQAVNKKGRSAWTFMCPGCGTRHAFYTGEGSPSWTFKGGVVKPTFHPSLRVRWNFVEGKAQNMCHSYVRKGEIKFLRDCTHKLAGQTVPLQPIEAE